MPSKRLQGSMPRIDRARFGSKDAAVYLKPGARLLFIGDSVTDCGRLRPVGTGAPDALGTGYVAGVDRLLREVHPRRPVRITNMGVSGNTVRDLSKRWDVDVLVLEPEWLAVMIGINDVWRQFDPGTHFAAVMPDDFELTYEMLLRRTRPNLKGLVLMTPFYVETDRTDPMRRKTDAYGVIVKELARRHDALLVDTQSAFDHVLKRLEYKLLAPDHVHPTEIGHNVLAYAFARAVGVTPPRRR
jgi:lysophospholipase L1-like esterase